MFFNFFVLRTARSDCQNVPISSVCNLLKLFNSEPEPGKSPTLSSFSELIKMLIVRNKKLWTKVQHEKWELIQTSPIFFGFNFFPIKSGGPKKPAKNTSHQFFLQFQEFSSFKHFEISSATWNLETETVFLFLLFFQLFNKSWSADNSKNVRALQALQQSFSRPAIIKQLNQLPSVWTFKG